MEGKVTHVVGLNLISELYVAHSVHNLTINTLTNKCYTFRPRLPKHSAVSYWSWIVLYELHLLYFIRCIFWLTYWWCFWTSQRNFSKHDRCKSCDFVHLPRAPLYCFVSVGRTPSRSSGAAISIQELHSPDKQIHLSLVDPFCFQQTATVVQRELMVCRSSTRSRTESLKKYQLLLGYCFLLLC